MDQSQSFPHSDRSFAELVTACALCIAAAGMAAPTRAQEKPDLPEATSSISAGCFVSVGGDLESQVTGPLPIGLSDDCEASLAGDEGAMLATASIGTDFGPGVPRAGAVHAQTHSSNSLPNNPAATATVGGGADIYIALRQRRATPGGAPAVIPVVFHASGEGSVSGDNTFTTGQGDVSAGISGFELPANLFGLRLHSATAERRGSFDSSVTLDLEPWDPGTPNTYLLGVEAHCTSYSTVETIVHQNADPTYISGHANCQVEVSQSVTLDQSEFDRRLGDGSFPLADYYELLFSENVPHGDIGMPDAGTGSDASASDDAGSSTTDSSIANNADDSSGGGCTCHAGGRRAPFEAGGFALVLTLAFARRRTALAGT